MLSTDSEKFPYIHSRSGRTSHRPKIAQLIAISEGTTTAVRSMSGDGGCGGCGDCWAARPNEVRTRADGTALRIRGRTRDIMCPSSPPRPRACTSRAPALSGDFVHLLTDHPLNVPHDPLPASTCVPSAFSGRVWPVETREARPASASSASDLMCHTPRDSTERECLPT